VFIAMVITFCYSRGSQNLLHRSLDPWIHFYNC
jgi:hypothetical protein